MKARAVCWGLFAVILTVGQARADDDVRSRYLALLQELAGGADTLAQTQAQPDKQPPPKEKEKEKVPLEKKLPVDIFDPALLPTTESPVTFNPHMIGDFSTYYVLQRFNVTGVQTTTSKQLGNSTGEIVTTTTTQNVNGTRIVRVPVPDLGAFNIAENESPRPQDRVFFTYNYFGDVRGPGTPGSGMPITTTVTTSSPYATSKTTTVIPGLATPSVNLNREVFGFEKTFFDGNASVEVRMPVFQQNNLAGITDDDVADLTIIAKYAFLNDRVTGNVASVGLAVTAPTGPGIPILEGPAIHSTLLQPFVGYIWNFDRFYIQGFHSVVLPTDVRDVTVLFNDLGLNFWLYRGAPERFLNSIVPTIEAHVTTALNHRGDLDPLDIPDLVAITGGVHLGLGRNSSLTLGVVTPVSGPRLFNIEALAQFNWRF